MSQAITADIHSTYADIHIPREKPRGKYLYVLTFAALGIVYGDIGTSPLYAMRECFYGAHAIAPTSGKYSRRFITDFLVADNRYFRQISRFRRSRR